MTTTPIPLRTGPPPIGLEERHRLAARVRLLSWVSLAYMAAEGAIAILAGVMAGSIALIGFGIDSAIEGFASAIIVWMKARGSVMKSSCWMPRRLSATIARAIRGFTQRWTTRTGPAPQPAPPDSDCA